MEDVMSRSPFLQITTLQANVLGHEEYPVWLLVQRLPAKYGPNTRNSICPKEYFPDLGRGKRLESRAHGEIRQLCKLTNAPRKAVGLATAQPSADLYERPRYRCRSYWVAAAASRTVYAQTPLACPNHTCCPGSLWLPTSSESLGCARSAGPARRLHAHNRHAHLHSRCASVPANRPPQKGYAHRRHPIPPSLHPYRADAKTRTHPKIPARHIRDSHAKKYRLGASAPGRAASERSLLSLRLGPDNPPERPVYLLPEMAAGQAIASAASLAHVYRQ